MKLPRDVSSSLRSLRRQPALMAACITVLAIGIGANTAIFSAVKAILLDPLPYRDPSRLVALFEADVVKGDVHDEPAPGNFYDWQRRAKSFDEIAAYGGMNANLSGSADRLPEHVEGVFCSGNLFQTLGVAAQAGRTLQSYDDTRSAARTIVISDSLWKRRFAADPQIAGRTLRLDAEIYTIVGVMPLGFEFPDATTQFWIPMQLSLPPEELQNRADHRLTVIARLRRGVSLSQAAAEMNAIQSQIARAYDDQTGTSVEVHPLAGETVGPAVRKSIYLLWAAVGCVLLIACMNVVNLLLTRGAARRKEVALRLALGASKGRIVRLFLVEGMLLSLFGAAAGVLLATWLVQALAAIGASLPRASGIEMNWTSLAFAAALAVVVGIAAGTFPAFSASQLDLNQAMHETSRTTAGSRRSTWSRQGLVSAEIALSFCLLIGAGLLLKSFLLLENVDLGFNTRNLLTLRISLPLARYGTDAKAVAFFDQFLTRVRSLPGVERAGLVSWLPAAGQFMNTGLDIADRPALLRDEANVVIPRTADPGYFQAMGIPLRRGRIFEPQDRLKNAGKAVISNSLALRYFPNEDPIGRQVSFWNRTWQITGIVGDVRKNPDQAPEPTIYIPIASGELNFAALVLRSSGDPLRLALPVERELARIDPDLAASDVLTMSQLVSRRTANQHFSVVLLVPFAAVALLLTAVGLYGVVSFSASQRTAEFGVRLALGASSRVLLRQVLLQGLKPALLGIALGGVAITAAIPVLESMLFEVKPFDATVFFSVTIGLLLISLVAGLAPALRTLRLDPAEILRAE